MARVVSLMGCLGLVVACSGGGSPKGASAGAGGQHGAGADHSAGVGAGGLSGNGTGGRSGADAGKGQRDGGAVASNDAGTSNDAGPHGEVLPADRRIPWAPGIAGGIPARNPICASVTDPQFGAVGDGKQDDAHAIQAAIDACPEGQVVHVPAGTYRVTQTIYLLKGVVLRGDGPAATRIEGDHTPDWAILNLGEHWDESNTPISSVVSGYTKGSTRVVVADASS